MKLLEFYDLEGHPYCINTEHIDTVYQQHPGHDESPTVIRLSSGREVTTVNYYKTVKRMLYWFGTNMVGLEDALGESRQQGQEAKRRAGERSK